MQLRHHPAPPSRKAASDRNQTADPPVYAGTSDMVAPAVRRGVAQPGQRACFGYRRSWVRIPPPRPGAVRGVMRARIYQPPKTAMQCGWAAPHEWGLEFEPSSPRRPDPLMGWIGSADTQAQVRLSFQTREEAIAYAERQ